MNHDFFIRIIFVCLCFFSSFTVLSEQKHGESVLLRGSIADDVYTAGGTVDVLAEVNGDVVAAGGRVAIDSTVTGDVIAAGGTVTLRGRVDDDVRLAGGDVTINGTIGDDAVAAGGNVLLAPGASVGGNAMLSGGQVTLTGQVKGDARLAGGRLMIDGQVEGDVELAGREIEIGPNANILGKLTYRSPGPASIHSQARIGGTVEHIPTPIPGRAKVGQYIAFAGILLWLSLGLTGVAFYLLFSREVEAVNAAIINEPWKTLGLGLAVFAATPIIGGVLFSTALGWLIALVLLTVYALLMLFGYLNGVLLVSNSGLRRMRHGQDSGRVAISLSFMLVLLGVMIISLIPILGWLVVFAILLLGVGGMSLMFYRTRFNRISVSQQE